MAIPNSAYLELNSFNFHNGIASLDGNNGKGAFFIDHSVLLSPPCSDYQFSTSTNTFDDNSAHPSTTVRNAELCAVNHGSIGGDSVAESMLNNGGNGWELCIWPGPNQFLSPNSPRKGVYQAPAQKSTATLKNTEKPHWQTLYKMKRTEQLDKGGSSKELSNRITALKRNRLSASKSRRKRKTAVEELELICNKLARKASSLKVELASLLQETSQLKHQILQHAHCGDTNIETWVQYEARKYANRSEY